MTSYSTLTILLILIAALSTPAAAVNRKLQRRKGRKLQVSSKSSKCAKVTKDSCIHIVMDDLEAKNKNNKNFVDIAMKVNGNGNPNVGVVGVKGTTWLSNGKILDPNDEFKMEDYFYFITCDVLKGSLRPSKTTIDVTRAICHLDICIGSTYTDDDGGKIPDCVYLKGFITGKNDGDAVLKITDDQRLRNVADFYAMIVSGTGRFTGSIGYAYVQPEGNFDSNANNQRNWEIDLDASVSPWFNSELVDVTPSDEDEDPGMRSKEFSAMFTALP